MNPDNGNPYPAEYLQRILALPQINTFSMRAECRHDMNQFEVKLVEAGFRNIAPIREIGLFEDGPSGEEMLEIHTDACEMDLRKILSTIPDSHVIEDTLRPLPMAQNSMDLVYPPDGYLVPGN